MDEKRKRRRKGDKDYINNKEFTEEIIKSKKIGKLTNKAIEFITILANRAVNNMYFEDPRDREDCIQNAILDCLKYWKGFKPEEYENPNAFAYFTTICKNGYAKQWNEIHKKTGLNQEDHLDFISLNNSGDSSVYSI